MSRVLAWSVCLASGLVAGAVSSASAQGLPRILAPGCQATSAADPAACANVEQAAVLPGVTVVATGRGRQHLADNTRVAAVLGMRGPRVIEAAGPAVATRGGAEPVTTGSLPRK